MQTIDIDRVKQAQMAENEICHQLNRARRNLKRAKDDIKQGYDYQVIVQRTINELSELIRSK